MSVAVENVVNPYSLRFAVAYAAFTVSQSLEMAVRRALLKASETTLSPIFYALMAASFHPTIAEH